MIIWDAEVTGLTPIRSDAIAMPGCQWRWGWSLLSAIIMRTPRQDYPANLFFHVHLASGSARFVALGSGDHPDGETPAPGQAHAAWFRAKRRAALVARLPDADSQSARLRLPPMTRRAPLPPLLHGLGLLLVTAMAAAGLVRIWPKTAGLRQPGGSFCRTSASGVGYLVWVYVLAQWADGPDPSLRA